MTRSYHSILSEKEREREGERGGIIATNEGRRKGQEGLLKEYIIAQREREREREGKQ